MLEPMENLVCLEPPVLMELKESPGTKDPRDLRDPRDSRGFLMGPGGLVTMGIWASRTPLGSRSGAQGSQGWHPVAARRDPREAAGAK